MLRFIVPLCAPVCAPVFANIPFFFVILPRSAEKLVIAFLCPLRQLFVLFPPPSPPNLAGQSLALPCSKLLQFVLFRRNNCALASPLYYRELPQ
jgi:hypothetical protein